MQADLLDLYRQASRWTAEKVAGARDLEPATPCPEWRVRNLLNHILDTHEDGPARGHLRRGFYGTDRLGFTVTCADIAAFTVARLDDARCVGATLRTRL